MTATTTTTTTHTTSGKSKERNRSSNSSQQTTLQMSHSPSSKSQLYSEGGNGSSTMGNGHQQRTLPRYENGGSGMTQEYRSNGRGQRNGNGSHYANGNGNVQYAHYERNGDASGGGYTRSSYADRAYSLPRQQHQQQQQSHQGPSSGYYTQDRRAHRQANGDSERSGRHYRDGSREDPRLSSNGGADTPDFYFMPSQRKYSGEVVRVFVDYNKDPKH